MKTTAWAVCIIVIATASFAGAGGELKGTVSLSGAWALYPMAVRWAEEFRKAHPGVTIDVAAGGAGKGMADALAGVVDIGMVSRAVSPFEVEKGAWAIPVTRDGVVATINDRNPALAELLSRGATRDSLVGVWVRGDAVGWGILAGSKSGAPVRAYTRSDACGAAQTWAEYLGKKQEDLKGIGVYGDPGLADAVRKDSCGIGFNNINYVYDAKTRGQVKGIRVLPLDLDGNGRLDPRENFYGTRDEIVKAIDDGIYPSPPARDLYFVCRGRPDRVELNAFVKWVLIEGQKYVPEAGYINLPEPALREGLAKLDGPARAAGK